MQVVKLSSPAFHYDRATRFFRRKLPSKVGSLQLFVTGYKVCLVYTVRGSSAWLVCRPVFLQHSFATLEIPFFSHLSEHILLPSICPEPHFITCDAKTNVFGIARTRKLCWIGSRPTTAMRHSRQSLLTNLRSWSCWTTLREIQVGGVGERR